MANKEAIRLWVQALRSDEFTQGTGRLATINKAGEVSHCCLGVACEIYQRHVGDLEVDDNIPTFEEGGKSRSYDGEEEHLPSKVRDWLGLNQENPELVVFEGGLDEHNEPTEAEVEASVLNDDGGPESGQPYPFGDIADAIERTFLDEEKSA